jgi:hypothetical protein
MTRSVSQPQARYESATPRNRRTDRWALGLAIASLFTGPFLALLALALSTTEGGDPRLTRLARRVAAGALLLQVAGYAVYAMR